MSSYGTGGSTTESLPYLTGGMVLRGRYIIDSVIGSGGFGVTYKAWDSLLSVQVAVKEYFPKSIAGRQPGTTAVSIFTHMNDHDMHRGIRRFLQEAQDLARFNNIQGVVSVYDFFEKNGTAYMVMEYLDGCTLKEYMRQQGGWLSLDEGMYVMYSLMDVLQLIHQEGIIHRDISPDNIFICSDSYIKLLDFGAAKQIFEYTNETVSVVLKHGFAPPEQYLSKGKFGPWTDIYAFGATMYRVFTGVMPTESVERLVHDTLLPPIAINPAIPQSVSDVIMRAMSVDIKDRYKSVAEMKSGLSGENDGQMSEQLKKILLICGPIVAGAMAVIVVLLVAQFSKGSQHKRTSRHTAVTESTAEDTQVTAEAGQESEAQGSGSSGIVAESDDYTRAPVVEDDPTRIEAPDTSGWTESDKIYAYTWDNTFEQKLDIVFDKYPEYREYVEVVNVDAGGLSDMYVNSVDSALSGGAKYASIITADVDLAKYWSESDVTANLDELGFTDEVMANSYDFAIQYGTTDGHLKAVTWQSCAGSVFYRKDIARNVFGTDDPETVQAKLADWDTFMVTAQELKDAGYSMVSGTDDVKYAMLNTERSKWLVESNAEEKLSLDNSVADYLDMSKKLYDGGYTNYTTAWETEWWNNMLDSSNVFCYFGCPWFVGTMRSQGATDGNWGAVVGPTAYQWGGTYVMAGADTNNPELTAFIMWALTCDPDVGVEITNRLGECVNNKAANERLVNGGELADNNAASALLGGQNATEVWIRASENLDSSYVTWIDVSIMSIIDDTAYNYNNGSYGSLQEAVTAVENTCRSELGI